MNETSSSANGERVETARSLASALGAHEAVLAGALLDTLERLNLLVSVKEVASGRYLHANQRMAEVFGRSPTELIGAVDADLLDSAQATAVRSADQTVLASSISTSAQQRIERDGQKREFS